MIGCAALTALVGMGWVIAAPSPATQEGSFYKVTAGPIRFPTAGPANDAHVRAVLAASLAFWDTHLKADPTATKYLASDALPRATDGDVQIKRK